MGYWDLYLLTRLDDLQVFFIIVVVLLSMGILLSLCAAACCIMEMESPDCVFKYTRKLSWWWLPFMLLTVAVPSEKDLAIIIAGGFVTQSETVSELGETAKLGVEVLNKYLEELKEE